MKKSTWADFIYGSFPTKEMIARRQEQRISISSILEDFIVENSKETPAQNLKKTDDRNTQASKRIAQIIRSRNE